jgi:2-phosphosulfolactate phosphatase
MKIDAILSPKELPALSQSDLRQAACVVFDVLRATSSFVTALQNGAEKIIPVSEISEALEVKKQRPEILLGGERQGVRISANGCDFDFGNSPREYTPERVRGRTIVSTTTNGTRALRACIGAKAILAASLLNLDVTAKHLLSRSYEKVLLICAGTHENAALEDILVAGAMCELLVERDSVEPKSKKTEVTAGETLAPPKEIFLSDSAQTAFLAFARAKPDLSAAISESENARRLLGIPELRDDVSFCLQRDAFPLIAMVEHDGIIRFKH